MIKFGGSTIDKALLRKQTIEERQTLLSQKGALDYSDYLYCVRLELRDFEQVLFIFLSCLSFWPVL